MRILNFSDNRSDHNHRFLEKLISFGHEVYFLDATQAAAGKRLPAGVRELRLEQKVRPNAEPDQYAEVVPEFQARLRDLCPDLVHAGPVQTCGYVAALSGFHPLVVMSWGSDILLHANRNAEWRRATEITLRAADGFFCDCEAVRAAAQRCVVMPEERIVQFPWGIRRGSFSPQGPRVSREELGLGSDSFVYISTRSWEPLYDIDVLLEAFHRAWRRNNRLRLLLLGDGSEAGRVRGLIVEHALADVVLTPGEIPAAKMAHWFRVADAYISCARSDGTSVSLLQAMATGLPVVASDILSNREWITEGTNGWLAPVGSSEAFANKVLLAMSIEPGERAAISERNQRIVADRADWDKNFRCLLKLYEGLVSSKVEMKV